MGSRARVLQRDPRGLVVEGAGAEFPGAGALGRGLQTCGRGRKVKPEYRVSGSQKAGEKRRHF